MCEDSRDATINRAKPNLPYQHTTHDRRHTLHTPHRKEIRLTFVSPFALSGCLMITR